MRPFNIPHSTRMMHSGHYALYLSSSKWILNPVSSIIFCPFPPLCLLISWHKMTYNVSKQSPNCHHDMDSSAPARPVCENISEMKVADWCGNQYESSPNSCIGTGLIDLVWQEELTVERRLWERVKLHALIVCFTEHADYYDRNSTKSSVNIHEAQIRQQIQTVNKGWANTGPDYCQRSNMLRVLLSVLITKEIYLKWPYKMATIVNSQWQGNIRLHCFHLFTAWHFLPSTECALTVCQWPHHLDWTRMNI